MTSPEIEGRDFQGNGMNQLDLANRVAIVTGGARGIGYAIAERLLRSRGTGISIFS